MLHDYGVYRRVVPEQGISRQDRREHKEPHPTDPILRAGLRKGTYERLQIPGFILSALSALFAVK